MMSSKVILVQLVVIACLASLVLSASVSGNAECETCKKWAAKAKEDLPAAIKRVESFKSWCKALISEEEAKKCEKAIDEVISSLKNETPEQICTRMAMCGKQEGENNFPKFSN